MKSTHLRCRKGNGKLDSIPHFLNIVGRANKTFSSVFVVLTSKNIINTISHEFTT